jgi:hypothetical protein
MIGWIVALALGAAMANAAVVAAAVAKSLHVSLSSVGRIVVRRYPRRHGEVNPEWRVGSRVRFTPLTRHKASSEALVARDFEANRVPAAPTIIGPG